MRKAILFVSFTIMFSTLSGQNLYSELVDSDDHTIFLDLLEFIGLDSLLVNDDYHSVFAPDNEAFESRFDLAALDSLQANDPAFLESLLLNHFVPDTVYVEFGAQYLPLSGSHFIFFVDGAGLVLFHSYGTPNGEPTVYLSGTFNSGDLYTDLENGRLFGLEQNIVHPNCQSISEWYDVVVGSMWDVIVQANWIDSILNITTPVSFLCPTTNDIFQHIDENGGFSNAPFVDSLIRRHIINEYIPLQGAEEGIIVKNLLGEDLHLSKQDSQYFLNDSIEILRYTDFKKLATLEVDNFLLEPLEQVEPIKPAQPAKSAERIESVISTAEEITPKHFSIFPNPASDVVTAINPGQSKRSIVRIYTIDGNFIFKGEYFGSKFDVDISALEPGLYIIEHQNSFNHKRTKLLVF